MYEGFLFALGLIGHLVRLQGFCEEIARSKICLFRNVYTVLARADLKNHTFNGWTAFFRFQRKRRLLKTLSRTLHPDGTITDNHSGIQLLW